MQLKAMAETMPDLLEIPGSALADRQGTRLQAVLQAESCAEGWSRRRTFCGRLVIALSVPMACFLYRGQGISDPSARFVFVLWMLSLAGSLTCAWAAFRAERSVELLLTRAGGRRLRVEDVQEGPHASP